MKKILLALFIAFGVYTYNYIFEIPTTINSVSLPSQSIKETPSQKETIVVKDTTVKHQSDTTKIKFIPFGDKPKQMNRPIIQTKKISNKPTSKAKVRFKCDKRKYCSQMRSYEEAKYFLRNCRGVKMDGDKDGIPCERQFRRYD